MRRAGLAVLLILCAGLCLGQVATQNNSPRQYPESGPGISRDIARPTGGVSTACPCFTTASIQAVFATCPVGLTPSCPAPAMTLGAFCIPGGPVPPTNLGSWVQVAGANECSRTYQDLQTGDMVTETLPVTAGQRDSCTAILTAICPS